MSRVSVMPDFNFATPGVYVNEVQLPPSVAAVETAIPVFIGYSPRAEHNGASCYGKLKRIRSYGEFLAIYGPPSNDAGYEAQFYLVPQASKPLVGESVLLGGKYYAIVADPSTVYHLCNCVRHFFESGSSEAYVLSVGGYGKRMNKAGRVGVSARNPHVRLSELKAALHELKTEDDISLYVCPDAVLLSAAEHGELSRAMLAQCEALGTAIALLDVVGGDLPDAVGYVADIENFRNGLGSGSLRYGAAYYPFVRTSLIQDRELTFENLLAGDVRALADLLDAPGQPNRLARKILMGAENAAESHLGAYRYDEPLRRASREYMQIVYGMAKLANTLPASACMAGLYAMVDRTQGVWKAPANIEMPSVVDIPIRLSSSQQVGLNVDPVGGKSVNAIRYFSGRGFRVWGARTLAGNDNEWRYIPAQRTAIFVEQSVKRALRGFVFESNDANTWARVRAMVESFLGLLWREGGLSGSKQSQAYCVSVGLGQTMTQADLLAGVLRLEMGLALVRPAEFVVLRLEQSVKAIR